jgi:hypothetical protein
MELEIQYWIDEALENATRATGRILGRAASTGVRLPSLDQEEASNFDLTASKAAQAVMRAVTAYPLSDAQLERIVRMTLGKRVIAATTTTAGGNPPPRQQPRQSGPPAVSMPSRKRCLRTRMRATAQTAPVQRDRRLQAAGPNPHRRGQR